ncbi:hypothetical protein QUF70_21930 [Desulfobacterales bacterium HSG17]|nr:hypothetical protein [Desulfobacterales bacterium HSG17]
MTTMERWMNESYHKGVQELADLLIQDQFADHYQILKPLIYKIKDTDKA